MAEEEAVDATIVDDENEGGEEPGTGLEPAQQQGTGALLTLYGTHDPREIVDQVSKVATALKDVIDQQGMTTDVGGRKPHIDIEGWQTAGTLLGVQPVVVSTKRVEPKATFEVNSKRKKWGKVDNKRQVIEETEDTWTCEGYSYEAIAEARTLDGRVVGRGEALCSREEPRWYKAPEPAIKAMAQTRAMSRAMRGALAFVAAMAGYSTTPAEEMDGVEPRTDRGKPAGNGNGSPYGVALDEGSYANVQRALAFLLDVGDGPNEVGAGAAWEVLEKVCEGPVPAAAGLAIWEVAKLAAQLAPEASGATEPAPSEPVSVGD